MNFSQFQLDPRLMQGVKKAGYDVATPIQQAAIPAAVRGRDIIGTAQTGTGKTAAFVLPILNKLLSGQRNTPRALIVTPTRELAEQIHDVIKTLSAGTRLKSATIYGGVGAAPQIQALRNGAEILVACPGRLLDLIAQGHAKMSNIEILVLDEADRMFDMGFLPDVRRIVKAVPEKRQTMMFSATFPPDVELLAQQALKQPQKIAMGISRPAYTVAHALYPVPQHLKTPLLIELLKRTDTNSVLVFTRTKHRAHRVAEQIKRAGFKVTSLHGDRSQGQRQAALKGFKSGHHDIMVATDIAARGLDIETISHVINYNMPDTADAYIHRIGRTGRAQRTGDAFTLVTPDDNDMIRTLERIMGSPLERKTLEGFDYTRPAPPKSASGSRGRGLRPKRIPPPPARFQVDELFQKSPRAEEETALGWSQVSIRLNPFERQTTTMVLSKLPGKPKFRQAAQNQLKKEIAMFKKLFVPVALIFMLMLSACGSSQGLSGSAAMSSASAEAFAAVNAAASAAASAAAKASADAAAAASASASASANASATASASASAAASAAADASAAAAALATASASADAKAQADASATAAAAAKAAASAAADALASGNYSAAASASASASAYASASAAAASAAEAAAYAAVSANADAAAAATAAASAAASASASADAAASAAASGNAKAAASAAADAVASANAAATAAAQASAAAELTVTTTTTGSNTTVITVVSVLVLAVLAYFVFGRRKATT